MWGKIFKFSILVLHHLSKSRGHYSRDSAVGIATGYGLDGPGIEFRQEQEVLCSPKSSRPAVGPGFFLGGRAAGA